MTVMWQLVPLMCTTMLDSWPGCKPRLTESEKPASQTLRPVIDAWTHPACKPVHQKFCQRACITRQSQAASPPLSTKLNVNSLRSTRFPRPATAITHGNRPHRWFSSTSLLSLLRQRAAHQGPCSTDPSAIDQDLHQSANLCSCMLPDFPRTYRSARAPHIYALQLAAFVPVRFYAQLRPQDSVPRVYWNP